MNKIKSASATRSSLLISIGISAAPLTGWAADAVTPAVGQPAELQEVVVTGYAASLERALENKRDAAVVSDGISAEDIGKYPEQNLAESLQRITGVQITRNLGDGQFISVRGLDPKFTDVLYNGRQLPSGSGTRGFDFQVLSANFASQVDAYKSPTADMLESGLAATVNVQSIRPLAFGKERGTLNLEGVYDEQARGGAKPHLSGLYTNTFLDNRLGWMVGFDFNERRVDEQQEGTDGILPDGTSPGLYRVFSLHTNDLVGTDKRISAMSMLQFKVNDALELRLDTLASRFHQVYNYYQGESFYPGAGALGPSPTASQTLDPNNVEIAWSGSNVFAWLQANRFEYVQTLTSTALAGTLSLNSWTVDSEVSFGQAREETTQMYVSWYTPSPGATLWYDTTRDSGGPISYGFYNGWDPNNPSNYKFSGVQGQYQAPTTDRIWNFKVDGSHSLEWGWIKGVRVGADYEDRTLANTPNWMTNTSAGFAADMSPYLFVNNNPTFFSSYHGGAQVPKNWLTVNLDKFFAAYPLSGIVAASTAVPVLTRITVVEEKSEAAYGRVDFASEDQRWKGNAGVRAVHTEELSSGFVPSPGANLIYGQTGGASSLTYSDAAVQAQKTTYNDLLPDLNMSYRISDSLIARFAAARVLQRPDMNLLAAASSPNAPTIPPAGQTWVGTLDKGNPNLLPYRANQLDLALEWYFGKRNFLGADFFLKDVKNLVFTNHSQETDNVLVFSSNTTRPINLSVSQPVNGNSLTLKGAEVGYQQAFDFLPGPLRALGIQANYTHLWAGTVVLNQGQPALPLTGESDTSYNLGAYYDDGRLNVHANYNYRSDWVYDALSYFGDGLFVKGYGQIDVAGSYNLTSSVSLSASVTNVTQSALKQVDKYGVNRTYDLGGRRFYAGVRVAF